MFKFGLSFIFFVCYTQAIPVVFDLHSTQSVLEQIEPVLQVLHQRIDDVIYTIKNDVETMESQTSRYIENQRITASQNQMELIKGLIKRINEIISTSPRKDCISGEKDLVESLQRTSFQDIDVCQFGGNDEIKSISRRKFEKKDSAFVIKTEIGELIGKCIKFDGFDSLLADCLKVQAEKISEKINYLQAEFINLQQETSKYIPIVFDKLVTCNDYIKRQSYVEGNLIIERVTQCVHS